MSLTDQQRRLSIGMVCYPTFGGSGVVATELGKALAEKGHQVHFITYRQPARLDSGHFSSNLVYHEVTVSHYPLFEFPSYELALTSKIVEVAKSKKLDVLHVHYAIPHASAAYLAQQILREAGIYLPFITTLHGTDITLIGRSMSFKPVVTFAINHSDVVTAVSESLKKETCLHFDIQREIKVIPNAVNSEVFKPASNPVYRAEFAKKKERILVHASTFRKVKRIPDVIAIFDKVAKKIPAFLLMIGDGPERTPAEQLCRELGIADKVRFVGKQEAIQELLALSDLFLLPSEAESFGLVALEAMACGVPVVSSDAGGLPEVNINEETGFLCPVGDIEAMSEKALYILSYTADHLKAFKQAAIAHAGAFRVERSTLSYELIYYQLIIPTK